MIQTIFFGVVGVVVWSIMAAIFVFLATWMWILVYQLGGIRSTAFATLFTSCAITTGGFALLLSHSAIVPGYIVGAVITASWWPMLLAAIVLGDLHAADRNSHRSFTARGFFWYRRKVHNEP